MNKIQSKKYNTFDGVSVSENSKLIKISQFLYVVIKRLMTQIFYFKKMDTQNAYGDNLLDISLKNNQ